MVGETQNGKTIFRPRDKVSLCETVQLAYKLINRLRGCFRRRCGIYQQGIQVGNQHCGFGAAETSDALTGTITGFSKSSITIDGKSYPVLSLLLLSFVVAAILLTTFLISAVTVAVMVSSSSKF